MSAIAPLLPIAKGWTLLETFDNNVKKEWCNELNFDSVRFAGMVCCMSVSAIPLPQRPWIPLNQPDNNRPHGNLMSLLSCFLGAFTWAVINCFDSVCRPEHVSGAGAAEFPLVAQTYFCDSRSSLRDLALPLQPIFFAPTHCSAPARQTLARSGPVPLQCFKQQTEKSGPIFHST